MRNNFLIGGIGVGSCYGCTERHVGCHSDCEKYKKALEEYKRKKDAFKVIERAQKDIDGYTKSNIEKCKKRLNGRKK